MHPILISINIILTAILLLFVLSSVAMLRRILKKPVPYEQYVKRILPAEEYEEWEKEYSEMNKRV